MNYDDVDIVRCDIPDTEASREADTRIAALESILDNSEWSEDTERQGRLSVICGDNNSLRDVCSVLGK